MDTSAFAKRRNQALDTNSQYITGTERLTTWGSDWLWAVFSVMALSALIMAILSLKRPAGERTFYYLNLAVLTAATISYYSLASGLGLTAVSTEFGYQSGQNVGRSVSYVRYIDWFVTTPLLLAGLLLTGGMPTNLILSTIFADIVMIVTGLVGALTATSYKWGYFTFGCVAMFYIFWHIFAGLKYSTRIHKSVGVAYTVLAFWLIPLWCIYPVAWGLSEGGNVISVNAEMVFYGILDLLTKPVFAFMSIFLHRRISHNWLGLSNEPRMNEIERSRLLRDNGTHREKVIPLANDGRTDQYATGQHDHHHMGNTNLHDRTSDATLSHTNPAI